MKNWKSLLPDAIPASDPTLAKIFGCAGEITLPANHKVFRQGEPCEKYLMVMSGSVKVFSRAENGREIMLYRLTSGQSCVLTTSCLLASSRYPAEAVTETDVSALTIPVKIFNQGLNQSPAFRRLIFDAYTQRLADIIALVESISFGHIDVRLAGLLLDKAQDSRKLHITHQAIATELGTAREVISRHLKKFERRQWVKLQRGHVEVIHPTALRDFISMTSV